MIDWLTCIVPYTHHEPVFGGAVTAWDQYGALKWKRESFRQLEGSFESSAVAQTHFRTDAERSGGRLRHLWISGNPAKFLQGHNLFGSTNLTSLAPRFVEAVITALGLPVDDITRARWLQGDYQIDRVDVAFMLDVGSAHEVRECLNALSHQATYAKRGRGSFNGGTVGWGKRTTRQTVIKIYDKASEIQVPSHSLADCLPHREELHQFALGKLRCEVELHSKHLDAQDLRTGHNWHSDTASLQWDQAMKKLNISGQIPITPETLKHLSRPLQKTYMAWESGRDIRSYMSRQTFHRHRKALLGHGIEIAQPFNPEHRPKVISLQKVLQPVPARVPQWAYGTILLAA